MAVVFNDTFTEAAGNPRLDAHTPEVGTSWTEAQNTTAASYINIPSANDFANPASTGESGTIILMVANPSPGVVSYSVETALADNSPGSSYTDSGFALLLGYVDVDNYYIAGSFPSAAGADKKIYKRVAGVNTQLASGDAGITVGDVLTFTRSGTSLILLKNGTAILTASDSSLAGAGKGGLAWGAILGGAGVPHLLWRADYFSITAPNVGSTNLRKSSKSMQTLLNGWSD